MRRLLALVALVLAGSVGNAQATTIPSKTKDSCRRLPLMQNLATATLRQVDFSSTWQGPTPSTN